MLSIFEQYFTISQAFSFVFVPSPLYCSLFRYHPIDNEDEITETSVGGDTNRVVLRSKLLWAQMMQEHANTEVDAFSNFDLFAILRFAA